MANKNKNHTPTDYTTKALHALSKLGVIVMLAATGLSLAELAERQGLRAAAVLQPAYAYSTQILDEPGQGDHVARRSKEEVAHGSTTYGQARRTHSVTGKL